MKIKGSGFPGAFLPSAGEPRLEGGGRPNGKEGQHAERRFTAELLKASGKEPSAGGHSLDSAERVFGGTSALSDQGQS